MRDNCPLFPLLISNMLQAVARAVKQDREIRTIQIVKLLPTEDGIIFISKRYHILPPENL